MLSLNNYIHQNLFNMSFIIYRYSYNISILNIVPKLCPQLAEMLSLFKTDYVF